MATANPIEEVLKDNASDLKNESESEKVKIEEPSDFDKVLDKAQDKYEMMNVPTERKTSEDVSKLAAQVHAAEAQQRASNTLRAGGVNPDHQTYGVLGIPMAAAVHDYTLNQAAADQASVKTKTVEDEKAIKEHNESLARIRSAIEKENESK